MWAYFPVHKGGKLGQDINPAARVLLRIGSRLFDEQSRKSTGVDGTDLLRDHLGCCTYVVQQRGMTVGMHSENGSA